MINFDNPSPRKVEKKKPKYSPTDFHVDRKFQPLEGGQYQKIDGGEMGVHPIVNQWKFNPQISHNLYYVELRSRGTVCHLEWRAIIDPKFEHYLSTQVLLSVMSYNVASL